ncbi:MAG TPA: NAD-dependent epimerase/dehydratase family protein [Burkholderiaceae bacterium]|jgi:nucleoside-diphosphate-sugar epimerase|nr:NAD-dependent epimerase/dehydratase family protein [Burkholderiaceae bacterium]
MTPPASVQLVTGAAGFIGQALAQALKADPGCGIEGLVLTDRTLGEPAGMAGDIADPDHRARLFTRPVGRLFHFAGIVSGAAEADFEGGLRVNLEATLALLECCRRQVLAGGPLVRFVYASSIAVFGVPLPSRIDDQTPALPTLSYGAHKRVIELLIDDYTRRGFVDGRALRLPGVVVRPALPNGALSGFNSDLIREPLAGRPYLCPVGPQASTWVCSRARVIENLLRIAALPGDAIGPVRTVNAPALSVSVAQIRDALAAVDPAAPARVQFAASPPPELTAQFGAWPLDCSFERARALGLRADSDLTALLRDALSLSISDLPP